MVAVKGSVHYHNFSPAMDLTIRDTTEGDLQAIVDIYNDQIANASATFHTEPQTVADRTKWLADTQAEQYPCIVAEATDEATGEKRVVGFCSLWHYNPRQAYDG